MPGYLRLVKKRRYYARMAGSRRVQAVEGESCRNRRAPMPGGLLNDLTLPYNYTSRGGSMLMENDNPCPPSSASAVLS
jgi:hypothetical protein